MKYRNFYSVFDFGVKETFNIKLTYKIQDIGYDLGDEDDYSMIVEHMECRGWFPA